MRRSSCRRFAAAGAWKAGENLVCSAAENRSAGGLNGQGQRSVQDEISGQQERPDRRSRIRGRRRRAGSKGMEERRLSGEKGQPGFKRSEEIFKLSFPFRVSSFAAGRIGLVFASRNPETRNAKL